VGIISGFCHNVNKIFTLLGCYTVQVLVTNVSRQPIGPIYKGQVDLALENGADKLSQNVDNLTTNLHYITSQNSKDLN